MARKPHSALAKSAAHLQFLVACVGEFVGVGRPVHGASERATRATRMQFDLSETAAPRTAFAYTYIDKLRKKANDDAEPSVTLRSKDQTAHLWLSQSEENVD